MPTFFTVKKGDETRRVLAEDLAKFESEGWKPVGNQRITTEDYGEQTVSFDEARELSRAKDVDFVSTDELIGRERSRRKEAQHSGTLDKVQAFGEGGLNALTFGLADPFLEDLSEATGEYSGAVAARADVNPGYSTAGQVVGSVAGALLPGLPGRIGTLGKFTPAGAAAQLSERVAARIAVRTGEVGASTISGIVDGALFGAGQTYANAVLHDDPITAESILAEMGSNALYGGALSGALGMASVGFGKLSKRMKASREVAEAAGDELTETATRLKAGISDDLRRAMTEARGVNQTVVGRNVPKIVNDMGALSADIHAFDPLKANAKRFAKYADDVTSFNAAAQNLGVAPIKPAAATLQEVAEASKKYPVLGQPILNEAGGVTELGILLSDELGIDISKLTGSETLETAAKVYAANKLLRGRGAASEVGRGVQAGLRSNKIGRYFNAVDQRVGGVIGSMHRAYTGVQTKIARGVEGFAKVAGKHYKGTAPAASTVLASIRFDPDLGEKPKTVSKKLSKRTDAFMKRAAELERAVANPQKTKQQIAKSLNLVQTLKPGLYEQISNQAMNKLLFLHGLLPKSPNQPGFGPDRWQPSETEIDKFSRIVRAAEYPLSVLDDMNTGKLTQEAVDTVKQLYPEIYFGIQTKILENLDNIKQNSTYAERIQLGILFQVPTDQVLQPAFIQRMQLNFAQREVEQQQPPGAFSTPGNLQKSLTNQQTAVQRVESK